MHILHTISEYRDVHKKMNGTIGFVPTMGFLHEGHLELVRTARAENAYVVVSIFVNPTQFGPNEDFASYPRDTQRDLALLKSAGVSVVFMPDVAEMYPAGFQTYIDVGKVSHGLEGARRPGHFRGVATVVGKLFHIIQPDRAYFGQKDAQQVAVITQMVHDLAFPVEIKVVPIVRADDGLALSSRNTYLSPAERRAAPVLFRALNKAKELYEHGERAPEVLRTAMMNILNAQPLAAIIDYISIADAETLEELSTVSARPMLISLAVRFGNTRLIDNVVVG